MNRKPNSQAQVNTYVLSVHLLQQKGGNGTMSIELIILIVVLIIVFGGGGFYWTRRR